MQTFDGFPPGKVTTVMLPAPFFSDLLPLIDDLAELKVVLFCLRALQQQEGSFRYLRRVDFARNTDLLRGLQVIDAQREAEGILDDALKRAVERRALLLAEVELDGETEWLYFANSALGRAAVEQIEAGRWQPGYGDTPVEIMPERPNIYRLYEANIGPLTPMIAERLTDAESAYPAAWLEEAFRAAVENNRRHWRYIEAILKRWEAEGKDRGISGRYAEQDGRRYVSGKFADFIDS